MNTTHIVFLLLLICCIYTVTFSSSYKEHFLPNIKDKIRYFVEETSSLPINYIGCGKLTLSRDDPGLLTSANFYYQKKRFTRFQDISTSILPILQKLRKNSPGEVIGPVAVLVSKISTNEIEVIYLFPNFDKRGVPFVGYNAIAKAHRWYYRLVYSVYYKESSKFCINKDTAQCPNVPVRKVMERPELYGQTKVYAPLNEPRFGYGDGYGYYYDPYNYWNIYYYYTPCGTRKNNNSKYYAVYLLNTTDPLYNTFSINTNPNISFISEYGGIRYGCDFQVVSPNQKYMLRLEESGNRNGAPGLVLYKINDGNPFLNCREKEAITTEQMWKIPLSSGNYIAPPTDSKKKPIKTDYNYAHFKIENDVLYLIDKDVVVWSYKIDTPNSPAIVQLDDNGTLQIYDSTNKLIDSLTISYMSRVSTGARSSRYYIDDVAISNNERKYLEYMKRMQERSEAVSAKNTKDIQTYYNKEVCPIGFVKGEI